MQLAGGIRQERYSARGDCETATSRSDASGPIERARSLHTSRTDHSTVDREARAAKRGLFDGILLDLSGTHRKQTNKLRY